MNTTETAAVPVEELERRCGHECIKRPDHVGPHFYGYIGGPHSYEGVKAERDRLRGGIEDLRELIIGSVDRHDAIARDLADGRW